MQMFTNINMRLIEENIKKLEIIKKLCFYNSNEESVTETLFEI